MHYEGQEWHHYVTQVATIYISRYRQSSVASKSKYPLVFSPRRDSRDTGRDVIFDVWKLALYPIGLAHRNFFWESHSRKASTNPINMLHNYIPKTLCSGDWYLTPTHTLITTLPTMSEIEVGHFCLGGSNILRNTLTIFRTTWNIRRPTAIVNDRERFC